MFQMDKLKEDKKKRMEKFLQKKEEIEARKMVKQKDARRKISKQVLLQSRCATYSKEKNLISAILEMTYFANTG